MPTPGHGIWDNGRRCHRMPPDTLPERPALHVRWVDGSLEDSYGHGRDAQAGGSAARANRANSCCDARRTEVAGVVEGGSQAPCCICMRTVPTTVDQGAKLQAPLRVANDKPGRPHGAQILRLRRRAKAGIGKSRAAHGVRYGLPRLESSRTTQTTHRRSSGCSKQRGDLPRICITRVSCTGGQLRYKGRLTRYTGCQCGMRTLGGADIARQVGYLRRHAPAGRII